MNTRGPTIIAYNSIATSRGRRGRQHEAASLPRLTVNAVLRSGGQSLLPFLSDRLPSTRHYFERLLVVWLGYISGKRSTLLRELCVLQDFFHHSATIPAKSPLRAVPKRVTYTLPHWFIIP